MRELRTRTRDVNYDLKKQDFQPGWLTTMGLPAHTEVKSNHKRKPASRKQNEDSPSTNKENSAMIEASPLQGVAKATKPPKKVKRTVAPSRGRDQGMMVTHIGT